MSTSTALLLVASPRGFSSTSNTLGSYLLAKLQLGGYDTSKVHIHSALRSKEAEAKMLSQVADCDLLVLAFPLYVDCLPAPLITALERISEQRRNTVVKKPQKLLTIVNNGFPESTQNDTALTICRQFALASGFEWAGRLSLGGGGTINGAALEKAGYPARNAKKALDLAAKDLLAGNTVSEQAATLMAKPAIPRWLFMLVANRRWKSMAKRNGAEEHLYDKP